MKIVENIIQEYKGVQYLLASAAPFIILIVPNMTIY